MALCADEAGLFIMNKDCSCDIAFSMEDCCPISGRPGMPGIPGNMGGMPGMVAELVGMGGMPPAPPLIAIAAKSGF